MSEPPIPPATIERPRDGGPLVTDGLEGAVPELMVSLLERRYLDSFDAERWQTDPTTPDQSRPLLREVLALGRLASESSRVEAMPQVLSACHVAGQALVMTLFGDGRRHRLSYGARRTGGTARSGTDDYLAGQASVLQAHLPGLELGEIVRLAPDTAPDMSGFLRSAPALAVVTGIPSRAASAGTATQDLGRVVSAIGTRRYVLMVVAEPLSAHDLDSVIDRCRRLKSDVHTLVRRTLNRSSSDTTGTSTAEAEERRTSALPMTLSAAAIFCQVAGLAAQLSPIGALVSPVTMASGLALTYTTRQQRPLRNLSSQESRSLTRGESAELLDAQAEACEHLLEAHLVRLDQARRTGWWQVAVLVAAESEQTLSAVTGGLRSICVGEATSLDPIRVIRPTGWQVREALLTGRSLPLTPIGRGVDGHPLGPTYDSLSTCLSTEELAVMVSPPQREVPGLPVHDIGEFALTVAPQTQHAVRIGALRDGLGRNLGPVSVSGASLNRHVFIAGMTGYGKTTTAKNLLVGAYRTLGVPFLVIEPVKAEYRQLAADPDLGQRLRVYSIGGGDGALPLRLNPFQPVDGVPLLRHIDLLKAVFNASFPMYAGMPYVLEEAMIEIYTDRGWDLDTSTNTAVGSGHLSDDDLAALVPSLADLHGKIEDVLTRKQYGHEVHQNMGAALRSRLGSLMIGAKGRTLNTPRSVPVDELFEIPTVVELRHLGDDEEKAFVMALLLGLLYEYAEARQAPSGGRPHTLQHLTLIEEAHRLLKASSGPVDPEAGDPQAKAVTMFTDMLAEMRAYGEGFVVADQVPTKLAPDILKNSTVKIIHRLAAPDDRAVVAAAMNLTDEQSRHLVNLATGSAVLHDNRLDAAVLVTIDPSDLDPGEPLSRELQPYSLDYLHQDGGCVECPAPCQQLTRTRLLRERATPGTSAPDMRALCTATLLEGATEAWQAWQEWRGTAGSGFLSGLGESEAAASAYCILTRACGDWLASVARSRSLSAGAAALTPADCLAQDRAARTFGLLARHWWPLAALTSEGEQLFAHVQDRLRSAIGQAPPKPRPGCASCPAPCLLFPVAGILPTAVGQTVGARATAAGSADNRARRLAEFVDEEHLLTELTPRRRREALYCLVTTNADSGSPEVDQLLALLGTAKPPADA